MRTPIKLALASLIVALTTLAPVAANAATPGATRSRSHLFRDRTPRVHERSVARSHRN